MFKKPNAVKIEEFHKHLDKCKQCRDNPFGLCRVGVKLLHQAANRSYGEQQRQATYKYQLL